MQKDSNEQQIRDRKDAKVKSRKDEIINVAIDLFAKHGTSNVSIEMIAERLSVTRPNIYYYFKNKDAIIDSIISMFDGLIIKNIEIIQQHTEVGKDAESILSNLFLSFSEEDSEQGRKINRIIFGNHEYEVKIGKYLEERFYQKREARFSCIFDMLVASGDVKPFDTESAARILNKIFIASALQDTFSYPFESHELPQCLTCLRKDCLHIIKNILDGVF